MELAGLSMKPLLQKWLSLKFRKHNKINHYLRDLVMS